MSTSVTLHAPGDVGSPAALLWSQPTWTQPTALPPIASSELPAAELVYEDEHLFVGGTVVNLEISPERLAFLTELYDSIALPSQGLAFGLPSDDDDDDLYPRA